MYSEHIHCYACLRKISTLCDNLSTILGIIDIIAGGAGGRDDNGCGNGDVGQILVVVVVAAAVGSHSRHIGGSGKGGGMNNTSYSAFVLNYIEISGELGWLIDWVEINVQISHEHASSYMRRRCKGQG